jgi:histone-lysine N-methyltransferase SETD3
MNTASMEQVKHNTQRIAALAHEVVGQARNEDERWKAFLQLHAALQELKRRQQKKKKGVEPSGPTRDDLDQLRVWLLKNGLDGKWLEGIEFAANLPEGTGVVAKKDFKKGEPFLQVPRKLMFTCQAMQNTPLGQLLKVDRFLAQSPSLCLALHLLVEKHNHSSFWTPYLRTLPKAYGTCLYFTLEELEGLRGSPTFTSAIKVIATVAIQYTYIHDLFQVRKDILHINAFTWDEFIWAMSAVGSRQNQVPQRGHNALSEYALIPAWDMCNHDHGDLQTFWDVNSDSTESHAMRAYKKGEQVYIFYGPRPNSDLLLHAGFVYENNRFDALAIRVRLAPDAEHIKDKLRLLHLNNMKMDSQYYLYGLGLAVDLMAFLRIHAMNEQELQQVLAAYDQKEAKEKAQNGEQQPTNGEAASVFDPKAKLNDRNELAALQLAESKCLSLLSLYPTTLQDDQAALRSTSLTPNMRAVTLLRLKEKEILSRTLDAIRLLKGEVGSSSTDASTNGATTTPQQPQQQQSSKNKKRKNRKKKSAAASTAAGDEGEAATDASPSAETDERTA